MIAVRMWHRDGMPWWMAPIPPRRHFCRVQTRGRLSIGPLVDRCACGGIRPAGKVFGWAEKNSRRGDQ